MGMCMFGGYSSPSGDSGKDRSRQKFPGQLSARQLSVSSGTWPSVTDNVLRLGPCTARSTHLRGK